VTTTLSDRFTSARKRCGRTQDHLAKICNLTKGAISSIENGRNGISGDNVFPLADALGVSARWLMTGVGAPYIEQEETKVPDSVARIANHLAVLPDEKLQALSIMLSIKL
jgi:transcriptional regulator with XRE-family HTH domain